jgi:hypothetical protein
MRSPNVVATRARSVGVRVGVDVLTTRAVGVGASGVALVHALVIKRSARINFIAAILASFQAIVKFESTSFFNRGDLMYNGFKLTVE